MRVGMIEVLDTQPEIEAAARLECGLAQDGIVGPIVEEWTKKERHDPRVVGLLVTNQKPGIDSERGEAVKNGHRHSLGTPAKVAGIYNHDLAQRLPLGKWIQAATPLF